MPALVEPRSTKQASSKSGKSAPARAAERKLSLAKGKDDSEEAEVRRRNAAKKLRFKGKDKDRERERGDVPVAKENGKASKTKATETKVKVKATKIDGTKDKNDNKDRIKMKAVLEEKQNEKGLKVQAKKREIDSISKAQKHRQEKTLEKTATKGKIAKRKATTPSPSESENSESSNAEDEDEEGENEAEGATDEVEGDNDENSKENEEEEEEEEGEDAALHGFSSESDSSDEDDDEDDKIAPIDVGKLPTVAKDDASVKRKLDKAKKQQVDDRGVLYVGRIPHGFYEDQMKAYFSQFGEVTRLRLSRNKKTGRSKHYAFIEFKSSAVAQIVAETMDNYLLMGHLLQCKFIPKDEVHPELWIGANRKFRKVPASRVERHHQNKTRTDEEKKRAEVRLLKRQKQKKRRLEELGIDYDFGAASYVKKQKQNA